MDFAGDVDRNMYILVGGKRWTPEEPIKVGPGDVVDARFLIIDGEGYPIAIKHGERKKTLLSTPQIYHDQGIESPNLHSLQPKEGLAAGG